MPWEISLNEKHDEIDQIDQRNLDRNVQESVQQTERHLEQTKLSVTCAKTTLSIRIHSIFDWISRDFSRLAKFDTYKRIKHLNIAKSYEKMDMVVGNTFYNNMLLISNIKIKDITMHNRMFHSKTKIKTKLNKHLKKSFVIRNLFVYEKIYRE